jgi:hypothetical protein
MKETSQVVEHSWGTDLDIDLNLGHEDSGFLGCDAMSLGGWCSKF